MQSAFVWNRNERDLRRGWHTFLKGAFFALQDDADLYPMLWGESWSWVWPVIPIFLTGIASFFILGKWSYEVAHHVSAVDPWCRFPEVLMVLGLFLGLLAGFRGSPFFPMEQPWPLTNSQMRGLRLAGSFLHPASILGLILGWVAGFPWLLDGRFVVGVGLILLPVVGFRAGLGLLSISKIKRFPRPMKFTRQVGVEQTLADLFKNMAGRSGLGALGILLPIFLMVSSHLVLAFTALGYWWAIIQCDILRLEGGRSTLLALLPITPGTNVNARLRGVAQWASRSGAVVLLMLLVKFGPVMVLPGLAALVEMHLVGAAMGLWASASAPLDGWSLSSIQSVGLLTVVGGTTSGWLASLALEHPIFLLIQILVVLGGWLFLSRVRDQVVHEWTRVQERLMLS